MQPAEDAAFGIGQVVLDENRGDAHLLIPALVVHLEKETARIPKNLGFNHQEVRYFATNDVHKLAGDYFSLASPITTSR